MDRKSFSMQVTVCVVIDGPMAEETRDKLEAALRAYGATAAAVGAFGGVRVQKGERTLTDDDSAERAALNEALSPLATSAERKAELSAYIDEIVTTLRPAQRAAEVIPIARGKRDSSMN